MLIYRILSIVLFPFLEIYLFYRIIKKKEDKKRLKERFGKPTKSRPEGDVVWLHAVSVGEVNSALVLIDELLRTDKKTSILLTSTTLTSAKIAEQKLPDFKDRVIHQFLPIDSYYCVKDFIYFWQPKTAIFVESEIWPNLIDVANKAKIPLFLVNARMSEKSAKNWLWATRFFFRPFDNFATIFAQSEDDKERLEQLTKNSVKFYGNLKSQAPDLAFDAEELKKLKTEIGSRTFWLAASTHKGEEEIVIQTHQKLKETYPDLLTILVPRHPNRAEEIKTLIADINFAQRSKNQNITTENEIYLADSLNELGIFYRLVNFAFIGGSLAEVGGHNPFEPIKLECAVIAGSHVFNFKEIYQDLESYDASVIVNSATELSEAVSQFFVDENLSKDLLKKAAPAIGNSNNIVQKIVSEITN